MSIDLICGSETNEETRVLTFQLMTEERKILGTALLQVTNATRHTTAVKLDLFSPADKSKRTHKTVLHHSACADQC